MGERSKSLRKRIILGLTIGLVAWLFQLGPAGRSLEQKGLDLLFLLRGPLPTSEDIVIVAVDEPSFAELGLQWPWPRSLHARLVDRLHATGARVIALDILFSEPSDPKEDTALAAALRRAGNVILPIDLRVVESYAVEHVIRVPPLPDFEKAAAAVGLSNLIQDRDKVVRRAGLSLGGFPTFAQVVAQAAGWRGTEKDEPFVINYVGPFPAFRTVSYARALTLDDLSSGTFLGKTVFVGRSVGPAGRPVDDAHFTPYFPMGRNLTPGVEIHASIVDTLLRERPILKVPSTVALSWFLAWSFAAALLLGWPSPLPGLGLALGLVLADLLIALTVFTESRTWLPWVFPALSIGTIYGSTLALRWRQSEREKALIRGAFQHYVHPTVVQEILENPEKLRLGGQSVECTVLFSDLEGFTRIAEGLSPENLVSFLNEYHSAMTGVILAHRGMQNRTLGDGILALWGAPAPNPNHALDACRAALAMQMRLGVLNEQWAVGGRSPLRMRIGIESGKIVVGNIGSEERFDYTAVGDTVNLASRLEDINKLYGTGIILGEDTARRVKDAFVLRELDRIRVVGRVQPVRVYECVGERGGPSEDLQPLLEIFRKGLMAYKRREWANALDHFERALCLAPTDGPSRVYVERCQRYLSQPPPADWDGVYAAVSK